MQPRARECRCPRQPEGQRARSLLGPPENISPAEALLSDQRPLGLCEGSPPLFEAAGLRKLVTAV